MATNDNSQQLSTVLTTMLTQQSQLGSPPSKPSKGCEKCSQGIKPPYTDQTIAGLDDLLVDEYAEMLFCDCVTGRGMKLFYARRAASLREFLTRTEAAQSDARAAKNARLLRDAGIPPVYARANLVDLGQLIAESKDTAKETALDACRLLAAVGPQQDMDSKPSIYLYGPSGTLKTTLATAVYRQWMLSGLQGIWMDFGDTLSRIKAGYDARDGSSQAIIQRLQEVPVLLWDDFGNDGRRDMKDHARQVIHDVIYPRHANWRPTLLTGNLTPQQLEALLGEPIWRRMRQWAMIVPCKGKVYGDD